MSHAPQVRTVATGGARLVEVLAKAFADDPWVRWTIPGRSALRTLMSLFLRTVAFPCGVVLVAGDPVEGVAVLLPPGTVLPDNPEVGQMVLTLHGRRMGRALDGDAVLDRSRSTNPSWVLHTIGVDPRAQGRGVGSALLAECLALAGTDPLTLETASAEAVSWYTRRGLQVVGHVSLSAHGLGEEAPDTWFLRSDRG